MSKTIYLFNNFNVNSPVALGALLLPDQLSLGLPTATGIGRVNVEAELVDVPAKHVVPEAEAHRPAALCLHARVDARLFAPDPRIIRVDIGVKACACGVVKARSAEGAFSPLPIEVACFVLEVVAEVLFKVAVERQIDRLDFRATVEHFNVIQGYFSLGGVVRVGHELQLIVGWIFAQSVFVALPGVAQRAVDLAEKLVVVLVGDVGEVDAQLRNVRRQ